MGKDPPSEQKRVIAVGDARVWARRKFSVRTRRSGIHLARCPIFPATFGLVFAPDQERAAAEMLLVCRSGGPGRACQLVTGGRPG